MSNTAIIPMAQYDKMCKGLKEQEEMILNMLEFLAYIDDFELPKGVQERLNVLNNRIDRYYHGRTEDE